MLSEGELGEAVMGLTWMTQGILTWCPGYVVTLAGAAIDSGPSQPLSVSHEAGKVVMAQVDGVHEWRPCLPGMNTNLSSEKQPNCKKEVLREKNTAIFASSVGVSCPGVGLRWSALVRSKDPWPAYACCKTLPKRTCGPNTGPKMEGKWGGLRVWLVDRVCTTSSQTVNGYCGMKSYFGMPRK
jgi:hypothetical protein